MRCDIKRLNALTWCYVLKHFRVFQDDFFSLLTFRSPVFGYWNIYKAVFLLNLVLNWFICECISVAFSLSPSSFSIFSLFPSLQICMCPSTSPTTLSTFPFVRPLCLSVNLSILGTSFSMSAHVFLSPSSLYLTPNLYLLFAFIYLLPFTAPLLHFV